MRNEYFEGVVNRSKILVYIRIPAIIIFIFLQILPLYSQIILTEVMFDADTLESHNEYVEIYNLGTLPVDLSQWSIGDDGEQDQITDAGYGTTLLPAQFGIILDASYFANSTAYNQLIPVEALILTINDGSFGSYGWSNTNAENVILVNAAGDTVQVYSYSTGNSPGFSDEKILLTENNDPANWGDSRFLLGTPGCRNSLTPFRVDLAVDSIWFTPLFPTVHQQPGLGVRLKNIGMDSVKYAEIKIFADDNNNQMMDDWEIFLSDGLQLTLSRNDTFSAEWQLPYFEAGMHSVGLAAHAPADEDSSNDSQIRQLTIESEISPVVINEIMYRPVSGQPEWIELFNHGNTDINLDQWSLADFRDTVKIASGQQYIRTGDYLVLTGDSVFLEIHAVGPEQVVIISSFPSLNNDFDDLFIYSPSFRVIDHVLYSDSWMRRDTEPGTSLERINPLISSSLPDNWGASVDSRGSTPATRNSIYLAKPEPDILINIQPNPFSPDGDGFEDHSLIQITLPFATGYVSIDIYDITGRKIKTIADYQPVGSSDTFIWDGRDYNGRMGRIGIYILLVRIFNPAQDLYKEKKKSLVLMKRG
jgi:hypothetical protein